MECMSRSRPKRFRAASTATNVSSLSIVVTQTKRDTENNSQKRNTATRVEGGTGVAVWKSLAVDDSVKQLSTTATTLIGMVRAGNKFAQFQHVIRCQV